MSRPMYQVSWFSKKKGYGFVRSQSGEDIFVHHSDISSEGYRYLMEGEVLYGELKEDNGRKKLSEVSSVMGKGCLRCEVSSELSMRGEVEKS